LPFRSSYAIEVKEIMEGIMSELKLDIQQVLHFLDALDPKGRHTIASEAPFGGKDNGPRWEGGATYEYEQRDLMIEDIKYRQKRKSNVYYSVNRPCKVTERQGAYGKNNIDDIIAARALAFDIDFTVKKTDELIKSLLSFIDQECIGELKPTMVISTGGGFQILYFLSRFEKLKLYRPANNEQQKEDNKEIIQIRSAIAQYSHNFESMLRAKVPKELPIKIDNMSNVDRVMRLPGTVNYPKLEKQAKGQVPAVAQIIVDYQIKLDIEVIRKKLPKLQISSDRLERKTFIPRKNDPWTAYEKAKACIDFIRDGGLADSNETYTHHVMLPLIGAIHDDNEYNQLTMEEAEELFLEAVSGGERYNTMGRGEGYFRRQWRSHRPELKRNGTKALGGLIWFCTENGMELPWKGAVSWELDFLDMLDELSEKRTIISEEDAALLKKIDL
jgi:hypothetical protein